MSFSYFVIFFFFNDTATTEIYTLSLHDALPIYRVDLAAQHAVDPAGVGHDEGHEDKRAHQHDEQPHGLGLFVQPCDAVHHADRKSTRLNSSHVRISYAVFCLKKKKTNILHID